MGPDVRQIRYEIPASLHARLKARAARERLSLKDFVIKALEEALQSGPGRTS